MVGCPRSNNSLAGKCGLRVRVSSVARTGERFAIGLFCTGLLAVTLAPVAQNWAKEPRDDFPFSYYPMFSRPIGETYEVTHVIGLDGERREHVIPARYLGRGGFNEVRMTVWRAARENAPRFCLRVAERLHDGATADLRGVRKLVIRSGHYSLPAFYEGRIELRGKREHARCRVPQ